MKLHLCFKSAISCAAIVLFAAVSASSANASTLWDFSASGACGEVFSGSFVTNGSGILTSSSITGRGGCLSLKSLGQGNQDGNFTNIGPSPTSSYFTVADNPDAAGDDNLFVSFVNALTPAPVGTIDDVIPYDHGGDDGTSFYLDEYGDFVGLTSGAATVTPEPDSVLLLGSGLIPLWAMWRNRRKALRNRSPLQ